MGPDPSTTARVAAPALFAGVHLSGSNANKTSLVILEGRAGRTAKGADDGRSGRYGQPPSDFEAYPLKIGKVYEKIGSFGSLFSDERLVEILTHRGPFADVFIDCPLTVPPCVACQRPVCPGAVKCDDVSVAYMLKVSGRLRRRGARKSRPINPQSQRLWDVLQLDGDREENGGERLEPSYSANLAPLVARARTLQRRLNSLTPQIILRETAVANALEVLREPLELDPEVRLMYRSFEDGLDARELVIDRLLDLGWLVPGEEDPETLDQLSRTVETFHAFMCAWIAALHGAGLTRPEPIAYVPGEGWVHLPALPPEL